MSLFGSIIGKMAENVVAGQGDDAFLKDAAKWFSSAASKAYGSYSASSGKKQKSPLEIAREINHPAKLEKQRMGVQAGGREGTTYKTPDAEYRAESLISYYKAMATVATSGSGIPTKITLSSAPARPRRTAIA